MGTPLAGKTGRVQINNATNLFMDRWKVTPHGLDIPTTSFEDLGTDGDTYETGILGPKGADIEFSGYYDAATPPFSNPPNLIPGVYTPVGVNALQMYTRKGVNNSQFVFPSIRIIQAPVDVDVNGRINISLAAKSNGQFTYPTV